MNNARIQEAVDASMLAVWEQIIFAFMDCDTRVFPETQNTLLKTQIDATVRHYLQLNHPEFRGTR